MPQVAGNIRKSRAAILRAEGAMRLQALLAKHDGSLCNVLVEKNNAGHSEHFLPVVLQEENDDVPHGTLLPVRITGITEDKALGVRA